MTAAMLQAPRGRKRISSTQVTDVKAASIRAYMLMEYQFSPSPPMVYSSFRKKPRTILMKGI